VWFYVNKRGREKKKAGKRGKEGKRERGKENGLRIDAHRGGGGDRGEKVGTLSKDFEKL
jgi:hypothetical protein